MKINPERKRESRKKERNKTNNNNRMEEKVLKGLHLKRLSSSTMWI
jgi:hypothetical protein